MAITWPLNNEDLTTEMSVSILRRGSTAPFLRHTSAITVAWTETWPTFVLVVCSFGRFYQGALVALCVKPRGETASQSAFAADEQTGN